jgi:hypothetical protein
MTTMNFRYSPEEWQLFIDSSMHSVTALLLQEGNMLSSIPVAYIFQKNGNI